MEPSKEPVKFADYLTGINRRPDPNPEATKQLCSQIRNMLDDHDFPPIIPTGFKHIQDMISEGGFKAGELIPLMAVGRIDPYRRSDFTLYMVREHLKKNPNAKVIFPLSFEWSEYDEERFQESCRKMGLELKPTN